MALPVNLTNLRTITGGDAAMEQVLFASFCEAVDECRALLHGALQTENDAVWKQQAHALKGLALNLGADQLGVLCADAQNNFRAESDHKHDVLQAIDAELVRVKAVIS